MHDSNDAGPIYRESAGEAGELKRAVRHASAGLVPGVKLFFDGGDWDEFYSGDFAERLAPHLVEAYGAAAAGETDRVIAADKELMCGLDPATAERLSSAAGIVFAAREGARAMRQLERLRDRHPGCGYPAAFAAHAALFNVPLLHVLIAYLFVEWSAAGAGGSGALEDSGGRVDSFLAQLHASPEPVQQVLGRCLGGWAKVV